MWAVPKVSPLHSGTIPSSSSAIKYNNCDISYEHGDYDDDDDSEDDVIGDMIYKASNTR